jgi:hypothetical protein
MKKLIRSLLVLALAGFALPAVAQQYQNTTLISARNIPGGATSNYNLTIGAQKYKEVGISATWKLDGAGTDVSTITFDQSLDGSTWSTVGSSTLAAANAGTTTVTYVTNITMNAKGYIRLKSMVNGTSGQAITNLTISYSLKPASN